MAMATASDGCLPVPKQRQSLHRRGVSAVILPDRPDIALWLDERRDKGHRCAIARIDHDLGAMARNRPMRQFRDQREQAAQVSAFLSWTAGARN
jgi:uncharacterized protein involved in tellurium resistance